MRKLIAIYDGSIQDKNRDSYIKAILRNIENVVVVDYRNLDNNTPAIDYENDKVILLKPCKDDCLLTITVIMFLKHPKCDIEGEITGDLPITTEAILETIPKDLSGKTVAVINQSNSLGKPLLSELADRRANIISLNSTIDNRSIMKKLQLIQPDILITATGDDDFKLLGHCLKDIKTIIDLSYDTNLSRAIRRVPVIEILKERL